MLKYIPTPNLKKVDFIPNLQSFVQTFEMDPITQIYSINVYISSRVFVYSYILTDQITMFRHSINVLPTTSTPF
jgi:hypothetical protein